MKQLLDCHLLSVEHQSGHVIVVGVRPNSRTEVIPCLISKCRVTLYRRDSKISIIPRCLTNPSSALIYAACTENQDGPGNKQSY